jgi:hypothetical protein
MPGKQAKILTVADINDLLVFAGGANLIYGSAAHRERESTKWT